MPMVSIDRKALPVPTTSDMMSLLGSDRVIVAASSDDEKLVAALWCEVLSVPIESLSVTDDWFTVGGNSLLAMTLLTKLKGKLEAPFTIQQVFSQSVREMVTWWHENSSGETVWKSLNVNVGAASHAQQRLWLDEQLRFDGSVAGLYTIPLVFRVSTGNVSLKRLASAMRGVIARHGVLRTTLSMPDNDSGELIQVVHAPTSPTPSTTSDSRLGFSTVSFSSPSELSELMSSAMKLNFDLSSGPLFMRMYMYLRVVPVVVVI